MQPFTLQASWRRLKTNHLEECEAVSAIMNHFFLRILAAATFSTFGIVCLPTSRHPYMCVWNALFWHLGDNKIRQWHHLQVQASAILHTFKLIFPVIYVTHKLMNSVYVRCCGRLLTSAMQFGDCHWRFHLVFLSHPEMLLPQYSYSVSYPFS